MYKQALKTIDDVKNRVTELSEKFLAITDLLKEANGLNDRLVDIIKTLSSARMGIVYEMNDLKKEHDELKRSRWYSFDKKFADWTDSLEWDIQGLVRQWEGIDREIKTKENDLRNLEYQKGQVSREMENAGKEFERMEREFEFDNYDGIGWYAKSILSDRDMEISASFTNEFNKVIAEFMTFKSKIKPEELDSLVDQKAAELMDVIDKIKVASNELEQMKKEKKELEEYFGKLYTGIGEETLETEKNLIRIKRWIQEKSPKYKEAWLFLLDRVTDNLRKQANEFFETLRDLDERMKITVTPKTNKTAEGVWENIKNFIKKVWNSGKNLINTLKDTRVELEDFAYEIEKA